MSVLSDLSSTAIRKWGYMKGDPLNPYWAWGYVIDNATAKPVPYPRITVFKSDGSVMPSNDGKLFYTGDSSGAWGIALPDSDTVINITAEGYMNYKNPAHVVSNGYRLYIRKVEAVNTVPQPGTDGGSYIPPATTTQTGTQPSGSLNIAPFDPNAVFQPQGPITIAPGPISPDAPTLQLQEPVTIAPGPISPDAPTLQPQGRANIVYPNSGSGVSVGPLLVGGALVYFVGKQLRWWK